MSQLKLSRCEYRKTIDGTTCCRKASELAGVALPLLPVAEDACLACEQATWPHSLNHVTASLARAAARKARPEDQETQRRLAQFLRQPPAPPEGPGTELKRVIGALGIKPDGACKCELHAQDMNRHGVAWCRENIDTIVGWLREECERRGLPFVEYLAKQLVWYAIRKAGGSCEST